MTEGLEEKQPQQIKQSGEPKLPQGILSNPKYQAERGQLDIKKSAIAALAHIPCTSEEAIGRDKFIGYIEAHKQSSQIFSIINFLSSRELYACFDESEGGTSFINACNPEFIDTFCNKAQPEVTKAQIKVSDTEQKDIEKQQKLGKLRTDIKNNPHISEKDKQAIGDNNPDSKDFKDAAKSILQELKTQAQKSGDFQEYRSFVEQFHAIGAVSDQEFLAFKKELDGFLDESGKKGGIETKQDTKDAMGMQFKNKDYEKFGNSYVRFGGIGEGTDDIVRLDENGQATKRIVSNKSGYAREVQIQDTLMVEGIQKEGKINEQLSTIDNKLVKITEYKKEREKLEQKPETERTEEERKRCKELESLSEIEQKLLSEKKNLEMAKKDLPKPDLSLEEMQARKEEQAREVVEFVDDMGLNTIGIENVDVFFEALNSRMNNGNTFDINKGLTYDEKTRIKQFFIQFLGEGSENLFEKDETRLILGKEDELRERLKKSKGIAPPIKTMNLEEMKRLMDKGKIA